MHEVQKKGTVVSKHLVPSTVREATELLAEFGDRARLIAGGTDLLVEMDHRLRPEVDTFIDLTRIEGLAALEFSDHRVNIGALVTHGQVVAADAAWSQITPLAQACWEVASPQLRNQATVVGNVVTASPANDSITPLRALDAKINVTSVDGSRQIEIADFHTGVRRTTLQPGEIVTSIDVTPLTSTQRAVYVKAGLRTAQAISVVHLTVLLDFDDEQITEARVLLGSVAPTIVSAPTAEAVLVGATLSDEVIREATEAGVASVTPIDDIRATAEYRSHVLASMLTRALRSLRSSSSATPSSRVLLSSKGSALGGPPISSTESITTTINDRSVSADGAVGETLLDWLRDHAGPALDMSLTGTKEGCAEGECGACTVLIDDAAVMSCLVPAVRASGARLRTVEGLADAGTLHPIQQAFIDEAAVQCGYCIPGFLVAAARLLDESPRPSDQKILEGLSGNLCRCTGYTKIIDAVHGAVES